MKKLLLLLFSMLISFNSFAEWTPVDTNDDVTTFIDFNTIKKHNEFIYWWNMVEYEKESTTGKSAKFYVQGDCGISQTKILTLIAYNESMGKEELERETPDNPEWKYLTPDSVAGFLLDTSCRFVNASDIEQQEILEEIQSKEELQRLLRIDEAKAKAKEDLEQELELRLLELKKLVQQEKQELNELSELRANKGWILGDPGTSAGLNAAVAKAEFEKEDELLLRLLELEKLTQAEKQELSELITLRATMQEAFEREQFNRLLTQEVQAEQDIARGIIIEDQLNTLKTAYVNNIAAKVRNYWRYHGAENDWGCTVYVLQDRNGNVLALEIRDCDIGSSAQADNFKDSIERAVYKASPLPSAPDDAVFDKEIMFRFRVN